MTFPSSRTLPLLALLACLVTTSGCFHTRVVNRDSIPGESHEQKGRIFLWGLASSSSAHVAVAEKCPDGLARAESLRTFGDGLLAVVTLGLYTPVTLRYTCAKAVETQAP